jgi:tRNA-modifying protein YgfZ
MNEPHTAFLDDRGVVRVSGPDARGFLDGLVTCDMDKVARARGQYGALLTPQGKILFDFIITQAEDDTFLLDCPLQTVHDLIKRLGFYKLRAKVSVEDISPAMGVVARWGEGVAGTDPRLEALGERHIVPRADATGYTGDYHGHRIALGVPDPERDFFYGDAFPHEANMDQLQGVDFQKGCYVGQEVVSRMQHRGTARTRIVKARFPGGTSVAAGTEITAGGKKIGKTGSFSGSSALAMVRIDRVAEALTAGDGFLAGDAPVLLEAPDYATFVLSGTEPESH